MTDGLDLIPAAARALLDPGMARAFAHELALDARLGAPKDLAEQRARGIAAAAFWNEGLPAVRAEDHAISGPGGTIPVRLFRGSLAAPAPVLLYVYGGGWAQGSVVQNEPAIRTLVTESGWTVAAPTYRLAPEQPFPAGLEDCIATATWLCAEAGRLGIDAGRIAVAGASAGANLALAAALALRDRAVRTVGMVLFYGAFGGDLATPSYRRFGNGEFGLSIASMRQYLEWYDPAGKRAADPLIAPLLADLRGLPPAHLVTAGLDVLHDDTIAMHARLQAAGVPSTLRLQPRLLHGFINKGRLVPSAGEELSAAAGFLRSLAEAAS